MIMILDLEQLNKREDIPDDVIILITKIYNTNKHN